MTDLLLGFDFPPMGGGIARWMAEVARRYPPGELVVSTGTLPDADDGWCPNRVDRLPIRSGRLKTLPGLWAWRRRVRTIVAGAKEPVRFVWCGNLRPAGYVAARTRQRDRIPYGVMVHGGDLLQLRAKFRRSPVKRAAARMLLGAADLVVANSAWTARLAGETLTELGFGAPPRRRAAPVIETVPLGTDPTRFRPDLDPAPAAGRYRLGPGPWLLTVARLVPHKGIDVAIEAVARMAERVPAVRYLVVGEGPDRARLEAIAIRLGVAGRVRFLAGVPDDDLPGLYRNAALYLGLSRAEGLDVEGFGIALADAQGAGVPVVAGAAGGTADALRDGETGVLVPPADPAAVARVAGDLLLDPARAAGLGRAGRRLVERELNWDRVVARLRDLSRSAASSGRR